MPCVQGQRAGQAVQGSVDCVGMNLQTMRLEKVRYLYSSPCSLCRQNHETEIFFVGFPRPEQVRFGSKGHKVHC